MRFKSSALPQSPAIAQKFQFKIPRLSIQVHLLLFILWGIVTIAIVISWGMTIYVDQQRKNYEENLLAITKLLVAAVEQKIQVARTALEVLADSEAVKRRDFDRLHALSLEVSRQQGGTIVFQDSQRQIFNTRLPKGVTTATPTRQGMVAIETGKWSASDLFLAPSVGKLIFIVNVPVLEDGEPRFALSLAMDPAALTDILIAQDFPEGWRASVTDRAGLIMARNVRGAEFLGQRATPDYLSVALTQSSGVFASKTLDGLDVLTAVSHTSNGWAVGVGVDFRLLDAPLASSLLIFVVGGLVVLLVSGGAALWWGGRLTATTAEMAAMATALGRGEDLPDIRRPAYQEAGQVFSALMAGSLLLTKRAAERDASLANLGELTITLEQRVAERTAQLKDAAVAAKQANEAKSEFLANMSHELRTPLNAVIGFAQLLQMKLAAQPEEKYAGYIRRAGEELNELIKDVLDLAKIESGRLRLSIEVVSLKALFEHLHVTLEPLAQQNNVNLFFPLDKQDHQVRADSTRLMQVFVNFGTNAIKYNRPAGSLAIEVARREHGWLRVSFVDTGIGIPPERHGEVFAAFNRLGAERSAIEGTGIGLAISHKLVDLMGGRIGFHSAPGVGSRFWVEFAEADPGRPSLSPVIMGSDELPSDRPIRKILYVEDNPSNLLLMTELFGAAPATQIYPAPTGSMGFDLALAYRPDVIILDIHLPDMSGYDLLERLRAVPEAASIPVIALTAAALPDDVVRGEAAGFFRYMTKPFDFEELQRAIDAAIEESGASKTIEG